MSKLPNPVANFRGLCAESFEYSTDFSEKDGSFVIHSTSRIVRQNIYRQTTFEYNHLTFKQNQHTHTSHKHSYIIHLHRTLYTIKLPQKRNNIHLHISKFGLFFRICVGMASSFSRWFDYRRLEDCPL